MPRATASSPARWRGASPSRPGSISPRHRQRPAWPHRQGTTSKRRPRPGRRAPAAARAPRRGWCRAALSRRLPPRDQVRGARRRPRLSPRCRSPACASVIARRLTEAEADRAAFLSDRRLRDRRAAGACAAELNERGRRYKLSVNDFVIKAAALALRKVPAVNASLDRRRRSCNGRRRYRRSRWRSTRA